ncbi:phosphatidate cytidylyltransferase [Alicyclobacillus sp. ALC3]|uniref:phosphatidate cytidylyltransferase n=1 Tax=Alicyclobacillus sp. ALC3 TaxID=2796143 RepID=UPI0023787095|nr:phosphatidate cytidylyltransferase [Alicyclobacillus sp. ALC3]WDL97352.1 phosphatidate cytidylyltransferase [Alicyclobacillus sp. ALC3]
MLTQRIWSGFLAGLIVLLAIVFGDVWVWKAVVFVATVICVGEFAVMLGATWKSALALWVYLVIIAVEWWPYWHLPIALETMVAITLLFPVAWRNRVTVSQAGTTFVGALYIGYGGLSLDLLRALPHGQMWLWLVLIAVWTTDTAAYFGGRLFKGNKLWPDISPKKTVSGAITGFVAAALSSVIVGIISVPRPHVLSLALLGAVISVISQLGDLVESAYKRSAGVKDSGRLLPGHGGMLDRVDGLLFAAPFALFFITVAHARWFF